MDGSAAELDELARVERQLLRRTRPFIGVLGRSVRRRA